MIKITVYFYRKIVENFPKYAYLANSLNIAKPTNPRINTGKIMELSKHGEYNIAAHNNILVVDAHGPFTDELSQQYVKDMYAACKQFSGQPWGLLITFYGNSVFSPEAVQSLIEVTRYRIQHGMIANASVILESETADLQQIQLQHIYQVCNCMFHVFSDLDSAKNWLDDFISDKAKVI
jgi:hypothetical protein